MARRIPPVRDPVRFAVSRVNAMIGTREISAAVPAQGDRLRARRGAASRLDRSVRRSTLAAMPLTAHSQCNQHRCSVSFTYRQPSSGVEQQFPATRESANPFKSVAAGHEVSA